MNEEEKRLTRIGHEEKFDGETSDVGKFQDV